ncbi:MULTISPECIES: ribonuclease III domain-containing protein [Psychrilyobacter]|uniref:Mini-ribonuclease 3 n=1 Tax=Psychrilyobacter piezotolerans TaxID=2293438 RepID=A0ABX9KEI8_9FUSO|nr:MULTISPECIES: ribonuclease III domain-containing protein [Psychrilyobacter]MCS5420835.1 Mini-ribonuclease 3-like protein [Psychrilyobacter sp. S5]NDI79121.1 Mini-ribonuclease 3-like protein [Psychrilyobacter piezotolerans]RDE59763.1 Mini-ribonuclease 3-like protein [Psychrilyobacter sp. S5]REI40089.1 Mini-ribonuclease 3-like protein [Psychrilyobacter piezotolerans]
MENIRVKELNGLALAYLGDAVWELRLREKFIARNLKVKDLNKLVKAHVSAVAQSKIYLSVVDELEDEYRACAKRARNSKISTFPKSCTMKEYKNATAFEALIAMCYINKREDIIEEIIENYVFEKKNDEK